MYNNCVKAKYNLHENQGSFHSNLLSGMIPFNVMYL